MFDGEVVPNPKVPNEKEVDFDVQVVGRSFFVRLDVVRM